MSVVLEVEGLDVAYGKVKILEDIAFRVEPGEIVALLGTNGAGKSTLLRTISGVLRPLAGTVRFGGRDITGWRSCDVVRAGLVQMPGGRGTFPGLTVAENLKVGVLGAPRAARAELVDEVLGHFPALAERRDQLAGTLSGGQQQMVALARALLARPRLLMVDELSLGLAPIIVADLLRVIEDLRRTGAAVVVVEQQVDLALSFADRAYFLERGRVRFAGPAGELRDRTDLLRAVFLGRSSSGDRDPVPVPAANNIRGR